MDIIDTHHCCTSSFRRGRTVDSWQSQGVVSEWSRGVPFLSYQITVGRVVLVAVYVLSVTVHRVHFAGGEAAAQP